MPMESGWLLPSNWLAFEISCQDVGFAVTVSPNNAFSYAVLMYVPI